jgi:hypothetical protein
LLAVLAMILALAATVPAAEPPVLLGLYPPGALRVQANIDTMLAVDAWIAPTGKQVALAGTFMDMEFADNLVHELDAAWAHGYVPFVNLATGRSAAFIATGQLDLAIREWAQQFALWSNGGQKRAFIAPMQEMNGDWTPYSGDPGTFIPAFRRVRQLFEEELAAQGLPSTAISWVFAPNGWSPEGHEFERYYPGDDVVDVVSFSAYNYGSCAGTDPWVRWETYEIAMEPYLHRMRLMAPGKPIFIAETGVVDAPVQGVGDKNQWLLETFTRLAAFPSVRGVLYFNKVQFQDTLPGCPLPFMADFRLLTPQGDQWLGFWLAMQTVPNYGYWAPDSPEMTEIAFGRQPERIFADVDPVHPFAIEEGQVDFAPWIHALHAAGITSGCSTDPLRYCPDATVTRGQMAVFLLRGIHGTEFAPGPPTGLRFGDVPANHLFAGWIEAFADEGLTSGCGNGNYCPESPVTRGQMAVFLLRAIFGAGHMPPVATGALFGDVPADHLFAAWIEQLAAEGITGGCGSGNFCPEAAVTRAQMAVFLVRAFNLLP